MLKSLQKIFSSLTASMRQSAPPPARAYHLDCDSPRLGWAPSYERILIIDDMPHYTQAALETLRVFYEEARLTVHIAHTFADGLMTFQQNDIQLVILDLDLNDPQGSGEQLLTAFQAQKPKVVVLANSSEQKYNDILLKGGAVATLAKEQRKLRRWLRDNGWKRTGGPA